MTAPASLTPEQALTSLAEGNQRYRAGALRHPRRGAARRAEVLPRQAPLAVVVGCSDSRVPPEIVFDLGIGDLFVVRTAGHVLDDAALASVEYALEHLGCRLVLVLGHARCGAIAAALSASAHPGHIQALVASLLGETGSDGQPFGGPAERAERSHVAYTVRRLRALAPVLAPLVASGAVEVRGAYYHLESGQVELLDL